MKQLEQFFSLETSYDRKHINNTCNRPVPQEMLDKIERGCSIEQLEEMMRKKFDVFRYKTQITIHGLFPEISTRRIGMYVNLTQNKNRSIGVRYTAIDHEKKSRLYGLLKEADDWHIERNSTTFSIVKMERLPSVSSWHPTEEEKREQMQKAIEITKKYRDMAERIDRSLFIGYVSCYLAETMIGKYVVLAVNILCFYERNFRAIFENISGKTLEEGQAIAEQKRMEREKRDREWHEDYERRMEESRKKKAEAKEKFLAENPLPDGFVLQKFEPQPGDIWAFLSEDYSGNYEWKFCTATKHAGRVLGKFCDKNGEVPKYAKGTVMKGEIEAYLKRQEKPAVFAPVPSNGKLFIREQTSSTFLLAGETYPFRNRIKELGGRWNKWQKGWTFTKTAEKRVREEFGL